MQNNSYKLAVLIDGDNTSYKKVGQILKVAKNYGSIIIQRIYADWTSDEVKSWKKIVTQNGIVPVQQYRNHETKNATDSAMIIDAMDILHSGKITAILLVTSDSDFTKLAQRIREADIYVIGMGFKKSSSSFLPSACNEFIFFEDVPDDLFAPFPNIDSSLKAPKIISTERVNNTGNTKNLKRPVKIPDELIAFFLSYTSEHGDTDGWFMLNKLSDATRGQFPGFSHKKYEFTSFKALLQSLAKFEFTGDSSKHYLRVKKT